MSEIFNCWHCGSALKNVILPMSRREECWHCGVDQHVCKMCLYYDANNRLGCDEELAEQISERGRANFCDFFKPSTTAYVAAEKLKKQAAKAKLADLFSENVATSHGSSSTSLSPVDLAKQKLKDLFKD